MTKLAVVTRAARRRDINIPSIAKPRRVLICVWARSPATGRLACRWHVADSGAATSDMPSTDREQPPSTWRRAA